MDRGRLLDRVDSLFQKSGFNSSLRCCVRRSCFDFVARRKDQFAFVKVYPFIGNVNKKDADELLTLAEIFSGTPLFVCEKTRIKPLEDDTVYSRYGVGAVTHSTLEDVLLRGIEPLIEAGPGGYYVKLDGEAIRNRRLERGLSIGKMAEVLGVSRRTLYGYERGLAKASVSTAYKIDQVLGIPVVKPVDISRRCFFNAAKRIIGESRFVRFIIRKLLHLNFAVFQLRRAPFDFVAKAPKDKTILLSTVSSENEENFRARTQEILSVGRIVNAKPIFVSDNKEFYADGIPLIYREDFENIKCCEDFLSLL